MMKKFEETATEVHSKNVINRLFQLDVKSDSDVYELIIAAKIILKDKGFVDLKEIDEFTEHVADDILKKLQDLPYKEE